MKRKSPPPAAKSPAPASGVTGNAATAPLKTRSGPRPMHLHMLTTACLLSAAAAPLAQDPEKRAAVTALVEGMAADMMRGLDVYRSSLVQAARPAHTPIWQQGTTRLLRVEGADKNAPHVLLVPSLINGYEILDLDAQHSFASFLLGAGFAPYILDWAAPGPDEAAFRIDDYITSRLHPAMVLLKTPHVIGYCMGGTMAAGAVAALGKDANVRSLTLLAAPWDFHAGDKMLPLRVRAFALSAAPVMQAQGVLPVDWIQALFASVDPLFAFNKFRALADMDQQGEQARRFVIVEDWLNSGPDLVASAARQAMDEWYGENHPANGVWTIGPALADAASIAVPTLVVAAGGDRLVPQESALAIMQQIVAAQSLTPDIGHIGMMASARARASVWEPVAAWLRRQ